MNLVCNLHSLSTDNTILCWLLAWGCLRARVVLLVYLKANDPGLGWAINLTSPRSERSLGRLHVPSGGSVPHVAAQQADTVSTRVVTETLVIFQLIYKTQDYLVMATVLSSVFVNIL